MKSRIGSHDDGTCSIFDTSNVCNWYYAVETFIMDFTTDLCVPRRIGPFIVDVDFNINMKFKRK